jgi:hypothetical protein
MAVHLFVAQGSNGQSEFDLDIEEH